MNGQSSLWLVHSIQFFDWNGVHRRNISPTCTPGAPEPVIRPPACQEPDRSGFPLGSLGVGAFGSGAAAPPRPPPRPPGPPGPAAPPPPCASNDKPTQQSSATVAASVPTSCCLFITEPLRMASLRRRARLLNTLGHRDHDINLADLGHLRPHLAHDGAVLAFDHRAGVERLDLEQRIVPVLPVAVDELRR